MNKLRQAAEAAFALLQKRYSGNKDDFTVMSQLAAALMEPEPEQELAWREAVQRLVTGFEHLSGIARQWEPDHASGADRAKWALGTEACADVANLLRQADQVAQRQKMTDEEIADVFRREFELSIKPGGFLSRAARAIETKLKGRT